MNRSSFWDDDRLRSSVIEIVGPVDGMCRHCGADLWRRKGRDGRPSLWCSFIGLEPPTSTEGVRPVFSRFCPREGHEPKHEHAPLRTDRPDQLEAWLARGQE